jgi:Leucine-rich repeat (LRR) protein
MDVSRSTAVTAAPIFTPPVDIPAPASNTATPLVSGPYVDNGALQPADQNPPLRRPQQLALILGANALEELGGTPALHAPRELAALGGRLILENSLHGDDNIRTGLLLALANGVHQMEGQALARGDYDELAEQLHAFLENEFKKEFAVSHAVRELACVCMRARQQPVPGPSEGVDPDAGLSRLFDKYIEVAADKTAELVDAWLSCIAAQAGLDVGTALLEIAIARLQYYRREGQASRDAAFVYVDMDQAPAPGYIATLHASTGRRQFFLCVEDGSVLPMVTEAAGTDGALAYDVAAKEVPVYGSAANEGMVQGSTACGDAANDSAAYDGITDWLQRHAHIIFGSQDKGLGPGRHARVVLDRLAQGRCNELAQWLTPVLRGHFHKSSGVARAETRTAQPIDTPPHIIPFRRTLVAMQNDDIDAARSSGGVDVLAFTIPMLCSALCQAAEAGRATRPLARAHGREIAGDVRRGERTTAGPADLRTGIRAALKAACNAVDTTETTCIPLPLDAEAMAEALRPQYPQLAYALQQAARRESGLTGLRRGAGTHPVAYDKDTALWRQADLPGLNGGRRRGDGASGLSGLRHRVFPRRIFHDLLASRINGSASTGQIRSFRHLLEKLEANPGGKAILRAMQAQHELLGEVPEIELRSGNGPARSFPRSTWFLDPDTLNAASIDDAVRELAAVYNNMTGVLHDVDCFAGLIASGKPELDPELEQAWQRWLAIDCSEPRRQAIDKLRLDLRTARCYGGMDKDKLRSLLSLGYIDDETPLGLNVRLPPGSFTAVPPLPDEVEVLDISSNPIQEWSSLPRGLKVLIARKTGKSVLEHLHLTPCLVKLDVSDNGLFQLPASLGWLQGLKQLHANGNYLSALPALPGTVETLVLRHNRFRNIPGNLPGRLRELDLLRNQISGVQAADLPSFLENLNLSINRLRGRMDLSGTRLKSVNLSFNGGLTELPVLPPTLTSVDAEGCALETLPENLPGLERLHVPYNRIRRVPRNLPSTLQDLHLAHNQIASLPDDLDRLTRCEVSLENNPILFRNLSSLAEDRPAPRIHFSMPGGGLPAAFVSSTLAQAVEHWLVQDVGEAAANWAKIGRTLEIASGDAHAARAFRLFLDRLRATVSFKNSDFRAGVREWLVELSRPERKSLLDSSMQVCMGATERCEDFVARVLNDLKEARLHDDIRLGRYDERVVEALDAMRQTFRRARLQDIAYRKIKSLQAVDDVEVYLAYEVKLRELLGLSMVVPDMRFFNVSSVGPDDLKSALKEVQEAERTGFYTYLVLDDTWHTLLKRKLGARYREAESRLEGLVNGESLQERIRAELQKKGQKPDSPEARLYNDPKLERRTWDEMRYEILEPLTRDLLANAGVPVSPARFAGPSVRL